MRGWSLASAGLVVGAGVSLVVTGLLVRSVTPEVYGNFATAASWVVLVGYLARFGVDRLALREIRRATVSDATLVNELSSSFVTASSLMSGATFGVLVIAMLAIRVAISIPIGGGLMLAAWVSLEIARPILMEVLRARLKLGAATAIGPGGRSTVLLIAIAIAVMTGRTGTTDLVAAGLLASLVTTLLGLTALLRIDAGPTRGVRQAIGVVTAGGGSLWLFTLAGAGTLIIATGDLLIVRAFGTALDAAAYATAVILASAVGVVNTSVNTAISPTVQDLLKRDNSDLATTILRGISTVASLVGIVVLAIATVVAWVALPELGGTEYDQTFVLVLALGLGQLAGVIAGPCGTILLLTGHERIVAAIIVTIAVATIAIEAALMARNSSLVLVAGVSAGAVAVHNALLVLVARRTLGITTVGIGSPRRAARTIARARSEGAGVMMKPGL
ncbi:MAG: hypothetical protein GY701_03465 [Sulfitobacter sp.]|nr:hypothetical protein [Sulfitobacter sp.]